MDAELDYSDPVTFAEAMTVVTSSGPQRFGTIMAPFQREFFQALAPSLIAVAAGEPPPVPRYWCERSKGASKDSDLAVALLWLLSFSSRPLRIQVAANDQEQADEIRLVIKHMLRLDGELNELISGLIDVQRDRIINTATDSAAQILTRDSRGGHGSRPDVLVCNELTHISDEEFASTCFDNLDKMPAGLGIIATNAGFGGSWQEKWKAIATSSHRWHVQEYRQPAPWISPTDLAESKKRNSASRFNRLWAGEWVSSGGDAIDRDAIQAAITLPGPTFVPEPGWAYVAGVDLGITRDASAIIVLARHVGHYEESAAAPVQLTGRERILIDLGLMNEPTPAADGLYVPGSGRIKLIAAQVFFPERSKARKVEITAIEAALLAFHRTFDLSNVLCDPWQAALLIERLTAANIPAAPLDFTGPNLRAMAQQTLDAFSERQVALYRDDVLLADLAALRIKETSYGYRLDSKRGQSEGTGHADAATAFSIALVAAKKINGARSRIANNGQPLLCWP